MLKLKIMGEEGRDIWLVEPGVTIGSAAGCEVLFSSDGIKDKHAEITVSGDELGLKNLCGDTQLKINNQPVATEQKLNIGDEIAVGDKRLLVVDPKQDFSQKAGAAPAQAEWSIKANHSALNNRIYPITGKMVLGRSNECDIVLSVTHLSRKHAELSVVGDKLMVKDMGSANGTYVNGKKVTQETLQKGDELRLDTLSFTVIGPGVADDMDATSVRAVITPNTAPPTAAKAAPKPTVKAAKPATSKVSRQKTAPSQPVQSQQESASAEGGGNILIPAVIVGVVVVAVVLYFIL
jgi:pSer/pThr/pTyr-binding forkhead associated (FHA) protein